jgi:hypothetical protein
VITLIGMQNGEMTLRERCELDDGASLECHGLGILIIEFLEVRDRVNG